MLMSAAMNDIKTSVITFPAAALSIEAIASKLKKLDAKTSPQAMRSIKEDIEVVSIKEDWSADDRWNITVGMLKTLEDNNIAYDQALLDTSRMDEITISVRFFNKTRSSTRITGKDVAVANHIRDTLEMAEYCEDLDELKMNLQTQLFAKTIPPLI